MRVQSTGSNRYAFDFGGGETETIILDGSDQPGLDGTLLSVKAQTPDTWLVRRKQGNRLLLEATWKLSDGGRIINDAFREFRPDGSTISIDYVYERAGGGSGFAADWRSVKETMNSPFPLEVKRFKGDGLSFVSPSLGTTRNVRFDGRDYPDGPGAVKGTSSSARRVDERAMLITVKHDGKVTATEDVVLSSDLKTLTLTRHIPGHDNPNVLVFHRG